MPLKHKDIGAHAGWAEPNHKNRRSRHQKVSIYQPASRRLSHYWLKLRNVLVHSARPVAAIQPNDLFGR